MRDEDVIGVCCRERQHREEGRKHNGRGDSCTHRKKGREKEGGSVTKHS